MVNRALTPAEHYTEKMNDGFWKHYIDIIDENGKPFQVILHHFTKPDLGDPHDHPGKIVSQIIAGRYRQEVYEIENRNGCNELVCISSEELSPGSTNIIEAGMVHKIVDLPDGEVWTIAHYSPHEKTSGFYQFDEDEIRHRYWHEEEFKPYKPE